MKVGLHFDTITPAAKPKFGGVVVARKRIARPLASKPIIAVGTASMVQVQVKIDGLLVDRVIATNQRPTFHVSLEREYYEKKLSEWAGGVAKIFASGFARSETAATTVRLMLSQAGSSAGIMLDFCELLDIERELIEREAENEADLDLD